MGNHYARGIRVGYRKIHKIKLNNYFIEKKKKNYQI